MLRSTMDTLSSHDVGPRLVPTDPPNSDAFARRAPVRTTRVTAPVAGVAADAASTVAAHESGPLALDRALAHLDGMADGARHRQAGDRHRLAPTGLPALVDLEGPAPPGATDRASQRPYTD